MPPKGERLRRLDQVLGYISKKYQGKLQPKQVKSLLHDARVPMEGDDEDTSSMSLIGYITMFPLEHGWQANVDAAIADYFPNQTLIKKEN